MKTVASSVCVGSGSGNGECPQLPAISVVTPCASWVSAAGWAGSVKSACEWRSTNPGAITAPDASMVVRAVNGPSPIAAIRPAVIATSARRAGVPVPSTTSPPVTVMS